MKSSTTKILLAATIVLVSACQSEIEQSTDGGIDPGAIAATLLSDPEFVRALAIKVVPVGTVIAYASSVAPPDGWIVCDGRAVSRTEYEALFGALSIHHGSGDGSTTFNLPDYRGRFLRGVDNGAGRDPDASGRLAPAFGGNEGDLVGSVQSWSTGIPREGLQLSASGGHTHGYSGITQWGFVASGNAVPSARNDGQRTSQPAGEHSHTVTGGDKETRPENAGVIYLIKAR